MLPQLTVPKLFSLIAAPHGIIDVYHSIDNNKQNEYIVANTVGTAFASCLWSVNHEAVMATFMIMSAYHWRHQFDIVPEGLKNTSMKGMPLILSSMFVSLSNHEPLLIYAFLTFIHTPHQYFENRDLLTPIRMIGILGLTYGTTFVLPLLDNFYENPIPIGLILGHIIYQEFVMENSTSII